MKSLPKTCDKCEQVISKGLRIITDEQDDLIFCKKCIKNGMHQLSMLKKKTPDQVDLLAKFRRYLKYEEN